MVCCFTMGFPYCKTQSMGDYRPGTKITNIRVGANVSKPPSWHSHLLSAMYLCVTLYVCLFLA